MAQSTKFDAGMVAFGRQILVPKVCKLIQVVMHLGVML
jgi:hypothetical protein